MSKAVLISIQPKWCELIASGKKTVEVRKSRPKLETPFKCYIYMTAGDASISNGRGMVVRHSGGKCVIGEFTCDYIEAILAESFIVREDALRAIDGTCMTVPEVKNYAGWNKGMWVFDCKDLFGWHISDLVIYDRPKTLYHFRRALECHRGNYKDDCVGCWDCQIKRAPQSWCYVEELEGGGEG